MSPTSAYAGLIRRLGFIADPFAKTNADEEERLGSYFIQPPFFNAVFGDPDGPKSTIVFAPRGGGKTALKRKIEIGSQSSHFLCVTYNTFPTGGMTLKDATSEYHLRNILRLVLVATLSECGEHGLQRLTKEDRHFLYLFTKVYLSNIDRDELKDAITAVKNLSDKATEWWNKFTGPVGLVINALLNKVGLGTAEIKKFEEKGGELGSYLEQFRVLRDIAQKFNKRSIYVLIDRVDELAITGSGSSSYQFIAPLLTDLHLLELRGYSFKFFLWDILLEEYRTHARPDRVKYYTLAWTHDQLREMISERLRAYSNGKVTSLDELLGPAQPLTVDRLVIYFALGSPRTIIRMCKEIVDQQSEINPHVDTLSSEAVYKGIAVFAKNFANDTVDPSILRDLKKVRKVNFTIKHLYLNVFKFSQQAGIAKAKQWQDAGLVERIGSVIETKGSKPSNLFGVTHPLLGKVMFPEISASEFSNRKLKVCANCNALLVRDWEDGNAGACQYCDANWNGQ